VPVGLVLISNIIDMSVYLNVNHDDQEVVFNNTNLFDSLLVGKQCSLSKQLLGGGIKVFNDLDLLLDGENLHAEKRLITVSDGSTSRGKVSPDNYLIVILMWFEKEI
jgi:hypothetical protein